MTVPFTYSSLTACTAPCTMLVTCFFCDSSLLRINQRHHSLRTGLWHTPPAAVKKPTEENVRERGLGVGMGRDSRYGSIYVCPPSPSRGPAPRCSSLSSSPPPQSPGSHTLNSSHWALAWDAGSAGRIERRSPDRAACSAIRWRWAGGGPASTLRVTVTPGWAFSP